MLSHPFLHDAYAPVSAPSDRAAAKTRRREPFRGLEPRACVSGGSATQGDGVSEPSRRPVVSHVTQAMAESLSLQRYGAYMAHANASYHSALQRGPLEAART